MKGDRWLWHLLLAFMIIGSSWFFGARPLREEIQKLKAEIEPMRQEYEEKAAIRVRKEEYIQRTADDQREFQQMLESYPPEITRESQIAFAVELERELGIKISSLSCSGPEVIYEFQYAPEGEEPYILTESSMRMPISCDYPAWKRLLDYVYSHKNKASIPYISSTYDPFSGNLYSEITLKQFAVTGEKRKAASEE